LWLRSFHDAQSDTSVFCSTNRAQWIAMKSSKWSLSPPIVDRPASFATRRCMLMQSWIVARRMIWASKSLPSGPHAGHGSRHWSSVSCRDSSKADKEVDSTRRTTLRSSHWSIAPASPSPHSWSHALMVAAARPFSPSSFEWRCPLRRCFTSSQTGQKRCSQVLIARPALHRFSIKLIGVQCQWFLFGLVDLCVAIP
jgi:hypothetical protein